MNDNFLRMREKIVESLPSVIETFIEYYGEEYRQQIEDKFNSMTLVCYSTPETVDRELRALDRTFNDAVQTEFLKSLGMSDEKISEYISYPFDTNRISLLNDKIKSGREISQVIRNYETYLETNNLENNIENLVQYFVGIGYDFSAITSISLNYENYKSGVVFWNNDIEVINDLMGKNYTSENISYDEIFQYFDRISPNIEETRKKIETYLRESYKEYRDYVSSSTELKDKLNREYIEKYLNEIYAYLSDKDKSYIDECKANSTKIDTWKLECKGTLVDSSFGLVPLIGSFSTNSLEKLNNPDTKEWEKKSIQEQQMKYFKKHGISYGTYEEYMQDQNVLNNIPSPTVADYITQKWQENKSEMQHLSIEHTTEYCEVIDMMNSMDLVNRDYSFSYDTVTKSVICISPNVQKKNNSYELKPFFIMNGGALKNYFDQTIFHELNHLVETTLIDATDSSYQVVSGWDELNYTSINSEENTESKRKYELFSEIINELTAQEVHSLYISKGLHIANDSSNVELRGGTSYEHGRTLITNFFEHFKEDIKRFRMTKESAPFFDKIGRENFENLNKLITDFFSEYTSSFDVLNLFQDIRNNMKSSRVIKFNELLQRSDSILAAMLEQEKQYNANIEQSKTL